MMRYLLSRTKRYVTAVDTESTIELRRSWMFSPGVFGFSVLQPQVRPQSQPWPLTHRTEHLFQRDDLRLSGQIQQFLFCLM